MIDWAEVTREHGPLVWRTALRLLKNEADAADCFQATFLAAFAFAKRETVRRWPAVLVRLATARAVEHLRSSLGPARRFEPLEAGEDAAVEGGADPLSEAGASELSDALRLALGRIDPIQAEVFCLACLDDLPHREIAALLGLTVPHVGVLSHRAKASLRRELRAFDPRVPHASEATS